MGKNYRWLIVAACSLISAVTMGIVNNCFGLYIIPVSEGLHVGRELLSTGQTLVFMMNMLMRARHQSPNCQFTCAKQDNNFIRIEQKLF